ARTPQSAAVLYRFGVYLEEDFEVPQSAKAIFERAATLEPDDATVEQKLTEAMKRVSEREAATAAAVTAKPEPTVGAVIAPETMGVKSPSHHRPSAAALIKRSGRLSVDRGRINSSTTHTLNEDWPEVQKKL